MNLKLTARANGRQFRWEFQPAVSPLQTDRSAAGRALGLLDLIRSRTGGSLAGLPDVIAVFPDLRIAFREAKCVDSKDRLSRVQHDLADLLRCLLGDRLDLQVVDWGTIPGPRPQVADAGHVGPETPGGRFDAAPDGP